MEDRAQDAREVLEDELRWFPESQLLLVDLLYLLLFNFIDGATTLPRAAGLLSKLKPENEGQS